MRVDRFHDETALMSLHEIKKRHKSWDNLRFYWELDEISFETYRETNLRFSAPVWSTWDKWIEETGMRVDRFHEETSLMSLPEIRKRYKSWDNLRLNWELEEISFWNLRGAQVEILCTCFSWETIEKQVKSSIASLWSHIDLIFV